MEATPKNASVRLEAEKEIVSNFMPLSAVDRVSAFGFLGINTAKDPSGDVNLVQGGSAKCWTIAPPTSI